jgi:hypothetical protein
MEEIHFCYYFAHEFRLMTTDRVECYVDCKWRFMTHNISKLVKLPTRFHYLEWNISESVDRTFYKFFIMDLMCSFASHRLNMVVKLTNFYISRLELRFLSKASSRLSCILRSMLRTLFLKK